MWTLLLLLASTQPAGCLAKVNSDFAEWKSAADDIEKSKLEVRDLERQLNQQTLEIDRSLYGTPQAQAHFDAVSLQDQLKNQAEDERDAAAYREKQLAFEVARKKCGPKR